MAVQHYNYNAVTKIVVAVDVISNQSLACLFWLQMCRSLSRQICVWGHLASSVG